MGTCLSTQPSEQNSSFTEFFYLCRELGYLLSVSESSISKFKYDDSIKIRKDSGVGYLNDGRIIVTGGTDSSGCLTNRSFILNPVNSTVKILPFTPISTKEGSLYQYKDFVYYIGALKDTDDEEILIQEQPAPIMRYHLTTNFWEVFTEETQRVSDIKELLQRSNYRETEVLEEIKYKDIIYPATFMIGSKVYLICGQLISQTGELQSINKTFSIDLEINDLDFKEEGFKFPSNVFRPICGSYKDVAFVTGGVMKSKKQVNKLSFLLDFSQVPPLVQRVPGLKLDLDDSYPVISSEKYFKCVAYPNVAIYNRHEKLWHQFKLEHIFVNRRDAKYKTPVLSQEAVKGSESIKNHIKLSIAGKGVKIINDDVPSGESLSEIDQNIEINLPPGLMFEEIKDKSSKEDSLSEDSSSSSNALSSEINIEIPEVLKKELRESSGKEIQNSSINKPTAQVLKEGIEEQESSDFSIIYNSSSKDSESEKPIHNTVKIGNTKRKHEQDIELSSSFSPESLSNNYSS